MNITHITFNLRTGGAETMMIDIINRQVLTDTPTLLLINEGHEDGLLSSIAPEVKVVQLHRPQGSKNPIWIWKLFSAIRATRPDVVHIHNARALGMLYGPKPFHTVYTYHCINDVNRWSRRADTLCSISEAVRADVENRGEGLSEIVFNGIDAAAITQRQERGLGKPTRIVQIGSLKHEIKGQDLSIEALALIRDKNVEIDFIGDGPDREMLEHMAAVLGVGKRVHFLGRLSRKEIYSCLGNYDLALLPSRSEGFGLALAEPMAAGVPVIASALPGPLEVLDGGRLGATFPAGDAPELAKAIENILASYDTALLRAAQAEDFVAKNFDISSTVKAYKEIYKRH